MHGPAAAVLALISQPLYLNLAVIGAIAVLVHETRALLGSAARRAPHPAVTKAPDAVRAPLNRQSILEEKRVIPGRPVTPPSPRAVAMPGYVSPRRTLPSRHPQMARDSTDAHRYVAGVLAITLCAMGVAILLLRSSRHVPGEPSLRAR